MKSGSLFRALSAAAVFLGSATAGWAQAVPTPPSGPAIERHQAPVAQPQGGTITAPLPPVLTDVTPLGVSLDGVRLLGPNDAVVKNPKEHGVVVENIGAMSHAVLLAAIQPFLGKPVSRQLMSEIQAAVAEAYRAAAYPFLSVTYPPQEISGGVLQLRVLEFHAGKVEVKGVQGQTAQNIRESVRLQPGDRINADELSEDLRWGNLYPYRSIETYFTPGNQFGASDFVVQVTEAKPWQVFAGVSNDGAPSTGLGRVFYGFAAGIPELHDLMLSYQLTSSFNFWNEPSLFPSGLDVPSYVSQSVVFQLPLAPRQVIQFAPNYSAVHQLGASSFAFNTDIVDLPIVFRSAISNVIPGFYAGDFVVGIEPKTESRTTYFGGTKAASGFADVFDLVFGWQDTIHDALGHTDFDIRLIANPGGVFPDNDSHAWSSLTNGRVGSSEYAYGSININRVTALPEGFSLVNHVIANAAGAPLPDTEQSALGGFTMVRGYTFDDGTVDSGVVLRNELRLPVSSPLSSTNRISIPDSFSPYVFVDYGFGRAFSSPTVPGRDFELASAGVGFEYRLGTYAHLTFDAAYALHNAVEVRSGDWDLQGELVLSY